MSNRRTDAIYLATFAGVVAAAVAYAHFERAQMEDADAEGYLDLPTLAFPEIDFEAPFEFPYKFVRFARPKPPSLGLGRAADTEAVIAKVRSNLIESSARVEVSRELQADVSDETMEVAAAGRR